MAKRAARGLAHPRTAGVPGTARGAAWAELLQPGHQGWLWVVAGSLTVDGGTVPAGHAMALPHDNCVDVYTPDLGLLAVVESGEIVGYNFLAGGGFGVTPSDKKTFPALAKRLAFVPVDQVTENGEEVSAAMSF